VGEYEPDEEALDMIANAAYMERIERFKGKRERNDAMVEATRGELEAGKGMPGYAEVVKAARQRMGEVEEPWKGKLRDMLRGVDGAGE
jgi:hypothetical protein